MISDLKYWHFIHATLSAIVAVLLSSLEMTTSALSFILGAAISQINIALLTWIWVLIQSKKSVAWAFLAIVSKYALLIWFLAATKERFTLDIRWLVLGVGFLAISSVVFALWNMAKEKN